MNINKRIKKHRYINILELKLRNLSSIWKAVKLIKFIKKRKINPTKNKLKVKPNNDCLQYSTLFQVIYENIKKIQESKKEI